MHTISMTSTLSLILLFLVSGYVIWAAHQLEPGEILASRSVGSESAKSPQKVRNPPSQLSPSSNTGIQDCQIRAWVRAADLFPLEVVRGEVRVREVGACSGEVAKYELGLRFRERSAFKFANPDAEFPQRPKNNAWGSACGSMHGLPEADILDIESWSGTVITDWGINATLWAEYKAAMRTPSLWIIKEQERIVFDARLPLSSVFESGPVHVEPFAVLVPNTNYPPAYDSYATSIAFGADVPLVDAEHRYEYVLHVSFVNGSTSEIYCGHTAFIPRPESGVSKEMEAVNVTLKAMPDIIVGNVSEAIHFDVPAQILLPKNRIVTQGSTLQTTVTLDQPNIWKTLSASLGRSQVEYTWAKSFFPSQIDEGVEGMMRHGRRTVNQLTAQTTTRSSGRMATFATELDPPDSEAGKVVQDLTVEVPPAQFPDTELFYATYSSELQIRLASQSWRDRHEQHVASPLNDDPEEEDWVPWEIIPNVHNTTQSFSASISIPLRVVPAHRSSVPSSDSYVPSPIHYLSPDARAPILIPWDAKSIASLEITSLRELEALTPLAKPRYIDFGMAEDEGKEGGGSGIKLTRYADRGKKESMYVGKTWQRKVMREAAKEGSVIAVQSPPITPLRVQMANTY